MRAPEKMAEDGRFTPRKWQRLFNQLRQYALTLEIAEGVGYRRKRTAMGTILDIIEKGTPIAPTVNQAFRIKTVLPDYLVCNKVEFSGVTPVADATDVNVARSYKLRKTPFDGKTVGGVSYAYATTGADGTQGRARTATFAGIVEAQTIVPAFTNFTGGTYPGDIIYADENPVGGTGVIDASGQDVTWIDQNRDGRAWAESFN